MRRKPRRRRDDSGGDGAAPLGRERRSQSEGPCEPSDQVDPTCSFGIVVLFGWVIGWLVICVISAGFVRRIAIKIVD